MDILQHIINGIMLYIIAIQFTVVLSLLYLLTEMILEKINIDIHDPDFTTWSWINAIVALPLGFIISITGGNGFFEMFSVF